jgi:3-oxoacyl-[acyl-carrier protein] reductase
MSGLKNLPMDYAGKTALVTGATRGIGRGIATRLASSGANVAVASRKASDAEAAASELETFGVRARGYECDVASMDDVARMGEKVVADFDKVDFLVNNAGITRDKLILRMTPEDWDAVIATNLTGTYNCIKVFAPRFLKQRAGRIVNITSVVGITGNAGQANYAASKAGIIGMTKSLARELAPRGITVNAIAPGYITTEMTDQLGEDLRAKMLETIPLGRFGTVEDVANVALFLLSDMAAYVTGQVLNCDGGMVMQ